MRWRMKARFGRALDVVPGGRAIHALAQVHLFRSVPLSERDFVNRCSMGCRHAAAIARHLPETSLASLRLFEFGSGWDLTIPQLLWMAGVEHQVTVDLNPLCRPAFVVNSRSRLNSCRSVLERDAGRPFRALPEKDPAGDHRYLRQLGIEYRAPADAAATGLPAESFDVVMSSVVLEHVPEAAILAIYAEMHRILRPGGIMSHSIDMSDHFAHSDTSISPWHFLRLDDAQWDRINSDLLFQNRLRAEAHLELMRQRGFRLETVVPSVLEGWTLSEEERERFAPPFRAMDIDVLSPTQLYVVARKE